MREQPRGGACCASGVGRADYATNAAASEEYVLGRFESTIGSHLTKLNDDNLSPTTAPRPQSEPEPEPELEAEPEAHAEAEAGLSCSPSEVSRFASSSSFDEEDEDEEEEERDDAAKATMDWLRQKPQERKVQPRPEDVVTEWRHGELLFPNTGRVSKFLLVPDHIEDAQVVLQKMLAAEDEGGWEIPLPSMTISMGSGDGNYMMPVGKTQKTPTQWDRFPVSWTAAEEPASVFEDEQKRAAGLFANKIDDVLYGVCRAAYESKGWILSRMGNRQGGDNTGAIADRGVKKFKQLRPEQASGLINVAIHNRVLATIEAEEMEELQAVGKDQRNNHTGWQTIDRVLKRDHSRSPHGHDVIRELWERCCVQWDDSNTALLGQPAPKRIVYADVPEKMRFDDNKVLLRDEVSHFVFCNHKMADRLDSLLESMVSHVYMVVSGKSVSAATGTWGRKAARGASIILLDNSGKAVSEIVSVVEHAKVQKLQLPELVQRCISTHRRIAQTGATTGGFSSGTMPGFNQGHGIFDGWNSVVLACEDSPQVGARGNCCVGAHLDQLPYDDLMGIAKHASPGDAGRIRRWVDQKTKGSPTQDKLMLKINDVGSAARKAGGVDYTVKQALLDVLRGALFRKVKKMTEMDLINDKTRWVVDVGTAEEAAVLVEWLKLDDEMFAAKLSDYKNSTEIRRIRNLDDSTANGMGDSTGNFGVADSASSCMPRRNTRRPPVKHHPGTWQISRVDKEAIQQVMRDVNFDESPIGWLDRDKGEDPEILWTKPPDEIRDLLTRLVLYLERRDSPAKNPSIQLPDTVPTSSFLIFDALKDTPDRVIEKLTSALALVGGDEMKEMGFQQTERARLKYAWELVLLYRHNANLMESTARFVQRAVMVAAFLTTFCAVLLNASNESPADEQSDGGSLSLIGQLTGDAAISNTVPQIPEYVILPVWAHHLLALGCAVLPMISALLIGLQSKFNWTKRWAMLTVAAERICSEIYLYRARCGEYDQAAKDGKLLKLIARHTTEGRERSGSGSVANTRSKQRNDECASSQSTSLPPRANVSPKSMTPVKATVKSGRSMADTDEPPEISGPKKGADGKQAGSTTPAGTRTKTMAAAAVADDSRAPRDLFYENVKDIQEQLMGSEVKSTSLQEPDAGSKSGVSSLLSLYTPPYERDRSQKKKASKSSGDGAGYFEELDSSQQTAATTDTLLELEEGGLSDFSLRTSLALMDDDAPDDGISLISAEDYMRFRLMPSIGRLNKLVLKHERSYAGTTSTIMLMTMVAAICGVIGLHAWIPAVTALVGGFESLASFSQTATRLEGCNGALTRLKTLRIWWQSLSRTQQKMPQNKETLIKASEEAIETEVGSWTQGMLRKQTKVDAAEEED